MDAQILAALVAAAASVVVALGAAVLTLFQQRSTSQAKAAAEAAAEKTRELERDLALAARLDLSRAPLLAVARDVSDRLANIIDGNFLAYVRDQSDPHRQHRALVSTAFRLARYWAVLEDLYGTTDLLAFERAESTQPITEIVNEIGRTFASDLRAMGGHRFMIWREEQRAVAELMTRTNETLLSRRYANFATFIKRFEPDFAPWLGPFLDQLVQPDSENSPRLHKLEDLFSSLVRLLEAGR